MAKTPYSDVRKYASRRAVDMLHSRASHESAMQDCRDYILPDIGQSLRADASSQAENSGRRNDSKIINVVPTEAAIILAAGMQSGLTSPSRPWFRLNTPYAQLKDVPAVRLWLDAVQDVMYKVFSGSNLYNVFHDIYLHLGGFGTAAAMVVEDDEYVVYGYMFDQGSYALGCDKRGIVNSLYRTFSMTVSQLADEFGKDVLPKSLQDKLEPVSATATTRDDDTAYNVECLVEPNNNALDLPETMGRPYRSIYWLQNVSGTGDDKTRDGVLAIRGYSGNPIIAPRWYVPTGIYGFGPGRRAIGDCRQLQSMERDKLQALAKVVNPPMAVPDSMKGEEINTFPGGINYYTMQGASAGRPAITQMYEVRPDLQAIGFSISQVEQRIKRCFFNDLFMMLSGMQDNPQMTAREVIERHEEKLIMLGPVLERLHLELLDAVVDRVFQIIVDKRMLPPPPPVLAGMPLKIEYISVLAVAQRMVGMQSLSQFLQFAGQVAMAKPDALDNVDADKLMREGAEALGVPSCVVVDPEQVAAIRANRAKQQAAAQMGASMLAASQGARNLGQASTEQGSALGDLRRLMMGAQP